MYLHEEKEAFKDIIEQVAESSGRTPIVIEKDYYVTMILKLLAEQLDNCVFKGGTSLSKGFHVIDRFSEDIDITFTEHIGESRRKKLKNVILKDISTELGMPITNWVNIQSDRDYNAYHFSYNSVFGLDDDRVLQYVKLETALGSYAFPTVECEITNYIGDYLAMKKRLDLADQFQLGRFSMKLQAIERTFIDKVFALCDYYLQKKSKRYSRHLYDLYKLTPSINFNDDFSELVKEVRLSLDQQFDTVVVYNAFPHFTNPKKLIKQLAVHLKEGGTLCIAHGMSREQIDSCHQGRVSHLSNGLIHEDDMEKLFQPYFDVYTKVSNEEMYVVAGKKRAS